MRLYSPLFTCGEPAAGLRMGRVLDLLLLVVVDFFKSALKRRDINFAMKYKVVYHRKLGYMSPSDTSLLKNPNR